MLSHLLILQHQSVLEAPIDMSIYDTTTPVIKQNRKRKLLTTKLQECLKLTQTPAEEKNRHILISGDSGLGKKITTIKTLVKSKTPVLLCLQTNKNVIDKVAELKKLNINAQGITGSAFNLKNHPEYPITAKQKQNDIPWVLGSVEDSEKIQKRLQKKYSLSSHVARDVVLSCQASEPDWSHDVIVISQPRLRLLRMKDTHHPGDASLNIPDSAVVIIDNPFQDIVLNYIMVTRANNRWKKTLVNGLPIPVVPSRNPSKNSMEFYKKPDVLYIDYRIQNTIIWVTSDPILSKLIIKDKDPLIIDFHETEKNPDGGTVIVIPTKATRHKNHIIFPFMVAHLCKIQRKDGPTAPQLIANGLIMKHNLINTKGSNELQSKSLICKHSLPWMVHAAEYCEQLEIDDINNFKIEMMAAEFEQACSKNRGLRYATSKSKKVKNSLSCHAVDPRALDYIVENSNHNILVVHTEDQLKNREFPKTKDTIDIVCWFLEYGDDYFLNEIQGIPKRVDRIAIDYASIVQDLSNGDVVIFKRLLKKKITSLLNDANEHPYKEKTYIQERIDYLEKLIEWLDDIPI